MNGWFRLWNDMPTDPKWRVIARASKQPIALVMACSLFAMSNVSKRNVTQCNASKRGETHNLSYEDIAAALDADEADIEAVFKAMQGRFMDGACIKNWDKRQPKREDNSRERVAAHRAKKGVKRDVTHGNAPDTDSDTDNISISNEIESRARAEMAKPPKPKKPRAKKPAKVVKDEKPKAKKPELAQTSQQADGPDNPASEAPPPNAPPSLVLTPPPARPQQKAHVPDKTEPESFAAFWDGWTPHARSKKGLRTTALAKYRSALKETDHETLSRASRAYLAECRRTDSYTQHVSTWLHQRGWESEYGAGAEETSPGTAITSHSSANNAGRNGGNRVAATANMALADPVLRARTAKRNVE